MGMQHAHYGCICPYARAVFSVKFLRQIHTPVLETNRNTPLKQGQNEQQTWPQDHWISISRAPHHASANRETIQTTTHPPAERDEASDL